MRHKYIFLLSILSGILFSISWILFEVPFFMFIALIPLFVISDYLVKNKNHYHSFITVTYCFPSFLIWNCSTTWWIWYSANIGAIIIIVLNSLLMALVFGLYHYFRLKLFSHSKAYIVLISFWLSWEWFHLHWDLSWPWLNFGNVFANYPTIVQWYEYTGTAGGTLWILVINILLYEFCICVFNKLNVGKKVKQFILLSLVVFIPILFSIYKYRQYTEKINPIEIVIVQQNTDPYTEQYKLSSSKIIHRILNLARQKTDSNTNLLVCSESAIQDYAWEDEIKNYPAIDSLIKFKNQFSKLNIVIGLSTQKKCNKNKSYLSPNHFYKKNNQFYELYNTAMFLSSSDSIIFYHKSKLVPGVEKIPFPFIFKPFIKFSDDIGGKNGSHSIDSVRKTFTFENSNAIIGTAICYESAYGEHFSEFIKNGATIMTIITNDGWWKNSPGYKQHFALSRLRAIENRRSIARAANTGISAFINQKGDIVNQSQWWTPMVFKQKLNQNNIITIYTKFGDYISRIANFTTCLIVLLLVSRLIKKKRN